MSDRVGVMSQGKLQQVANPRDIYNNPANGFVASFVGENNIFTGTVGPVADGIARFDTPHGQFRARVNTQGGSEVKLYVRPEHTIISAVPGPENSLPATVTDVAFEGNFISVNAVSDTGAKLLAEVRNDGSSVIPSRGDKLHMSFAAKRASILPDGLVRGE